MVKIFLVRVTRFYGDVLMRKVPPLLLLLTQYLVSCANHNKHQNQGVRKISLAKPLHWFPWWKTKTEKLAFGTPTCSLFGHQGRGHDGPQQFGDGHTNTIVGSFQGFETQRGQIFQFCGPHENCLVLQLQQALNTQETRKMLLTYLQNMLLHVITRYNLAYIFQWTIQLFSCSR